MTGYSITVIIKFWRHCYWFLKSTYCDNRLIQNFSSCEKEIGDIQFSSVQFSCSVISDSLRPHESQHTRPPCPSPTLGVHSDSCPLSPWCHPAISSFVVPFSCTQSIPASESFQWVDASHEVAKVLEFQLQHHSLQRNPKADLLQNGLVGSPCSPSDSQESSPIPNKKFKINKMQGLIQLRLTQTSSLMNFLDYFLDWSNLA